MDEMDKKAVGIVTYWLKKRIGSIPGFSVNIIWKGSMFGHLCYMLQTTLADGEIYDLIYDGLRQIWYLNQYKKGESTKYMDDTVRAEIMRKVEL